MSVTEKEEKINKKLNRALNHQKSLKPVTYYKYPVVNKRLQIEKEKI